MPGNIKIVGLGSSFFTVYGATTRINTVRCNGLGERAIGGGLKVICGGGPLGQAAFSIGESFPDTVDGVSAWSVRAISKTVIDDAVVEFFVAYAKAS